MKKVTLKFPSYDLLWAFKGHTKAIHIHIEPKKLLISGLFTTSDIEMAITEFHAMNAMHSEKATVNEEIAV